jgi:hypothetical protein
MSGTYRWPFVALVPWVFPLFFAGPPLLAGVFALALTDLVTEIAEIYRVVERRYAP